jgi:nucleoside-triphosphatase
MVKHILLTGKPGTGKTTLIEKVITHLYQDYPHLNMSGFLTKEVRSGGRRVGFDIYTLEGKKGVLARTIFNDNNKRKRVGKYQVDLEALETIGITSLEKKADIIILDEIGKMELFSEKFKETINILFQEKIMILATISYYDTPDTKRIKALPSVMILEVTRQNRDQMLTEIMSQVRLITKP